MFKMCFQCRNRAGRVVFPFCIVMVICSTYGQLDDPGSRLPLYL